MGAVPKKKPSLSRRRTKSSRWAAKFSLPQLVKCGHCGAQKLPHRVCRECGYYRERQIIEEKTKVKKVKE